MWVLLVLGVLVGVRAWLWDRAGFRGRAKRRCRKCWYDLTAAVEGDGGFRCPECGKLHRTIRSMRKTRRSKRLVVVAVVLVVGAYAIQIRTRFNNQQFQQLGWPVLVPTPVLTALIPMMPDEAGSLPDRHSGNNFIPIKQYPFGERIAHQIKVRMYKPDETSMLDRWLFSRLAHRESWQVLTDDSSVRGQVYTYVYRALARQHRLSLEEERWARSVYWMDVESPEVLPQMSPVFVRVNEFRRLLDEGFWRVQIGKTLFETRRRSPDWKRRLVYVSGENAYHDGYVRIADFVRWPNALSSASYEDLSIRGRIYEGEPDVDLWWPVGVVEGSARIEIAGFAQRQQNNLIHTIESVEDEPTIEWLKRAIRVDFVWERRFPQEGDVPIGIKVGLDRDQLRTDVPGFTFGGIVTLHCKIHGPAATLSGSFGYNLLVSEPSWWALRDASDPDGRRVVYGNWKALEIRGRESELLRGAWGYSNAEGISEAWFEIEPQGDHNGEGNGNFAPLWDLDAKRVYAQTIKVALSDRQIKLLEGACRSVLEQQGIQP